MASQTVRVAVGVLGGMGPLATASFLSALVFATEVAREQEHIRVIVDSDPSIPDRTDFLLRVGPDPRPSMIRAAVGLQAAGAGLLVMPCNTANVFYDDIASAVSIPVVPWLKLTANEIVRHGAQSVGLLATRGTIRARVFQDLFDRRGVSVVVPDEDGQRMVDQAIYGPAGVKLTGCLDEAGAAQLIAVANELAARGATRVILGCTELPLGVAASDPRWPVPSVDPAVVVARETVQLAGARVRR